MQNRNRRPAPSNNGPDRNDNVAHLAYERKYSREDLNRLADESAKVMGLETEAIAFTGNAHRVMAAVRTALCILGFRAEDAIANGTGPGSAWAPFDDLLHLARTLGRAAEQREQERDAAQPAQAPASPAEPPHTKPSTQNGDETPLSNSLADALAAAGIAPSQDKVDAEDAAALGARNGRRPRQQNGAEAAC